MRLLTKKKVLILKSIFHVSALLPLLFLFIAIQLNMIGGEPVEYIIHFFGIGALNLLIVTLLISPVSRYFKIGYLLRVRRLVGLYVFVYASLHILGYVILDLAFSFDLFVKELTQTPYLWFGAVGYTILLVLAVTSFHYTKRKLGPWWIKIHKSIYVLSIIAPIHFAWSVKSGLLEPNIYISIFMLLLILRCSFVLKYVSK